MTEQEITDLLLISDAYLLEIVEEMLIQEKKGCTDCGDKSKAEQIIMLYSCLLGAVSIPLPIPESDITPVVSFTHPNSMNVGDVDQSLTVSTTNPNVSVLVTSLDTSIATIINGKLHAIANGTVTLRATSPVSQGYNAAYVDRTVLITVPIPTYLTQWTYVDVVPSDLTAMTFLFSSSLTSNANIVANFTQAGNNKYLIIKQPIALAAKSQWKNTNFNYGVFPDQVFLAIQEINGFRYYVSRIPVILDSTSYIITLS